MLPNILEKFEPCCLIKGNWTTTEKTFAVYNPADGMEITRVSSAGKKEAHAAIQAAHSAFLTWSCFTARERADILKRWHALTLEHVDPLAELLRYEQGKPYVEAKEEIYDGALFIEWYAEEAKRTHGLYSTVS